MVLTLNVYNLHYLLLNIKYRISRFRIHLHDFYGFRLVHNNNTSMSFHRKKKTKIVTFHTLSSKPPHRPLRAQCRNATHLRSVEAIQFARCVIGHHRPKLCVASRHYIYISVRLVKQDRPKLPLERQQKRIHN